MIKGKLRIVIDDSLLFFCPGCKQYHRVVVDPNVSCKWTFNNNYDKPTFTPSILIKTGHYMDCHKGPDCWCTFNEKHPEKECQFKCTICHSFITDGKIQFLSDCTHELAGQTVDMINPENAYD